LAASVAPGLLRHVCWLVAIERCRAFRIQLLTRFGSLPTGVVSSDDQPVPFRGSTYLGIPQSIKRPARIICEIAMAPVNQFISKSRVLMG
jgi:hypothetical protein